MKRAQKETYLVKLRSASRFGSNKTFYYRKPKAAERKARELKQWYRNVPTQQIELQVQ